MDGEAVVAVVVAVDGIVSLPLCLAMAQLVAWLRTAPACSELSELAIQCLPPEKHVSVEGWEQGMDVLFAALAQLPPTSSPHQPKLLLSKLDLVGYGVGLHGDAVLGRERVCRHLAQHLLTTSSWLETLILDTCMGAEGIAHIADALQTNTTLKCLYVSSCPEMGDAGVKHLWAMLLKNATLQDLSLSGIGMTGHGLGHLCYALSSSSSATTLKVLSLSWTAVGADVAAGHIGDLLAGNASLEKLSFYDRGDLEDREGRIGQGLSNNRTLKELRLELQCSSRATELKQLFSGLASNTTLNRLTLKTRSPEMLLPLAAPELGDMLAQNRSLKEFDWYHHKEKEKPKYAADVESNEGQGMESDNGEGTNVQIHSRDDDGEGHFAHALWNSSALQVLHIPAGVLGQRGLENLFTSLATYNITLRELTIHNMSGGVHQLALMVSRNHTLQKLHLYNAGYSAHDWATSILPALADNQGLKEIGCNGCDGIHGDEVLHAFNNLLHTDTLLENIILYGTGLKKAGKAAVVEEQLKHNKEFRATLSTVPSDRAELFCEARNTQKNPPS